MKNGKGYHCSSSIVCSFSVLHSQFFILHSQFFIPFSILHSILNSSFSILNSSFSILNSSFSIPYIPLTQISSSFLPYTRCSHSSLAGSLSRSQVRSDCKIRTDPGCNLRCMSARRRTISGSFFS
jgi:hypothetical protein